MSGTGLNQTQILSSECQSIQLRCDFNQWLQGLEINIVVSHHYGLYRLYPFSNSFDVLLRHHLIVHR